MEAQCKSLAAFEVNARQPCLSHWQVVRTYLSEVCLAVHMEPAGSKHLPEGAWVAAHAKEELYVFIRRLRHFALGCDIICPAAAVVPRRTCSRQIPPGWNEGEIVKEWIRDQQWHRGAFVLYLEEDDSAVIERLQGILSSPPIEPLMGEFATPRSLDQMIERIRKRFKRRPPTGQASQYVEILLERFDRLHRTRGNTTIADALKQMMGEFKLEVLQ